ncbi:MAG TPA: sigma-70 family RNA polymerase sigma factor [Tepidisphaeraceae bacterium]|jgi:RNA polymerase sigma-70 factor (ECF subfamily)
MERAETEQVRSDEQLLAAHIAGDRDAFAALVNRYQRELYHFLLRFLGDAAAADDVFQETFIQVHQSASTFETERRFRPWLFTISANKARDFLRSKARRRAAPLQASIDPGNAEGSQFIDLIESIDIGPIALAEKAELQVRVQAAVQRLPEHLREVILLAYFHQFPYKQIADVLGVPLGTVKSRLHAAVEAFARIWKAANPKAA